MWLCLLWPKFFEETFETHSREKSLKCDKCTYTSRFKHGLQVHTETVHDGVTHSCETCGKTYSQAGSLGTHKRTAHEGVVFSCEYCSHKEKRKANMLRHEAYIHMKGNALKCQTCDKTFKKQDSLKNHMLIHAGDFPFSCSWCSNKFRQKWRLTSHEKKLVEYGPENTSQNPFMCPECKKGFSEHRLLKSHLVVHSNAVFSCEKCGIGHKWRGDLKRNKCKGSQKE